MDNEDIRWKQRFQNFLKAFSLLEEAVLIHTDKGLNELEKQGLIQRFEFTHELAWNVLKDYFEYQGNTTIAGSRDATREAFHTGLLEEGEGWMDMIRSRNQSAHTYNEKVADELQHAIIGRYYTLLLAFKHKMQSFT